MAQQGPSLLSVTSSLFVELFGLMHVELTNGFAVARSIYRSVRHAPMTREYGSERGGGGGAAGALIFGDVFCALI